MQISSVKLNVGALILRLSKSRSNRLTNPARGFSQLCRARSLEQKKMYLNAYRYANTSSGIYAPSTLTSRYLNRGEPRGNLSVIDGNDHLPKLPVPSVESTLEKLKESIAPVSMNSGEFVRTLQLIDQFAKTAAVKLDLFLREKANKTENWLNHDWYVNENNLKPREPTVNSTNPALIYPKLPFDVNNRRQLVDTIAKLISSLIDFRTALIHGYNPDATSTDNEFRLNPNLCYNQYKYMFGSTRIPGETIDTRELVPLVDDIESRPFTFVLSFRGRFFEIQLENIDNELGRTEAIAGVVNKIIDCADKLHDDTKVDGLGVLSTANRTEWAKAYKLLDIDSLNALKEAQFVVCVDTVSETRPDDQFFSSRPLLTEPIGSENHSSSLMQHVLHGDSDNVGNRWLDKAIQLIVVADESANRLLGAGINYEHSIVSGAPIIKMMEYSYDRVARKNRESMQTNFFAKQLTSSEPTTFRQLRMFNEENSELVAEQVRQAKQCLASNLKQLEMSYYRYRNYGKNAIKSWHFPPDSWFQVALQLAYYNVYKVFGTNSEAAYSRVYNQGALLEIRSLTKEIAQFCLEPNYENMQSAIKSHRAISLSTLSDGDIDSVLMGYRLVFDELKTNNWSWGLPPTLTAMKTQQGFRVSKGNTAPNDLESLHITDLFTDEEISTISAFFNNELIKRSSRYALKGSQTSIIYPEICIADFPTSKVGTKYLYNLSGQQITGLFATSSQWGQFGCDVHEMKDALINALDYMKDIVEEQRLNNYKN